MEPKCNSFTSILASCPFVFPLMGVFRSARNSGSIEVITTFDYPGVAI